VANIVREELKDVRKHYGRPRRTVISGTTTTESAQLVASNGKAKTVVMAAAPAEDVWAYASNDGTVLVTARTSKAPASAPMRLADDARLIAMVGTRSDQRLLFFTEQGQAVRAGLSDNPIARSGAGKPVVSLAKGDRVAAVFSGEDAPYYLLVSAGGQVKRIPAKTVANANASGVVCCNVPEGDRVVAVVPHGEEDDILIAKAGGQLLRIETGSKLRPVPTGAAGMVAGVRLEAGDRVVGAVKAEGSSLLTVHASGMGLAVPLAEYPVKGRATGGVQSVFTDRPGKSPAGEVALIVCQGLGEVLLFTDRGGVFSVTEQDNPLLRRATNSRSFLPLGPGEAPAGTAWKAN
jgi:DNA gyrase subunit A